MRPPAVTGDHLHLMAALRLIITACGDGVSPRRPSVDCLPRKAALLHRTTFAGRKTLKVLAIRPAKNRLSSHCATPLLQMRRASDYGALALRQHSCSCRAGSLSHLLLAAASDADVRLRTSHHHQQTARSAALRWPPGSQVGHLARRLATQPARRPPESRGGHLAGWVASRRATLKNWAPGGSPEGGDRRLPAAPLGVPGRARHAARRVVISYPGARQTGRQEPA